MPDWQLVAANSEEALREIDQAHNEVEAMVNAAYQAALDDGVVDEQEGERIGELEKQGQKLKAARTEIIAATLKALDGSAEIEGMRRKFVGICQRLNNRKKELEHVAAAANRVGQALKIVARILKVLV
jgi:tellurite resistance protein